MKNIVKCIHHVSISMSVPSDSNTIAAFYLELQTKRARLISEMMRTQLTKRHPPLSCIVALDANDIFNARP